MAKERKYTDKFMKKAIRLALKGNKSVAAVAKELDMPAGTLRTWLRRHEEELREEDALEVITSASPIVHSHFAEAERNITRLREPYRTFLIIEATQGIIDNGGLMYFFASDWDGNPPYSHFIKAYNKIGHEDGARILQQAVESFPFKHPHRHEDKRRQFIEENGDMDRFTMPGWDDSLCGDARVWEMLAAFVRKHADAFELAPG